MRLSPVDFNSFLNQMGQIFGWRKAYACPCINQHSGAPKPNCPHCSGKGRLWDVSIEGLSGITGREAMKEFATFGVLDAGDIMLSIPSDSPLYAMGQYDRVLAKNRSEPFSLNFVRGQNDLIRFPVLSIERVFWLDDANVIHEAAPLPTVGATGIIAWGASAPPLGETYSVTGRRTPEFFCYQELPFDRPHHAGEPLPRRVVLRRFDLYGR